LLEASYVGNQSKYGLNQQGVGTNANVIPFGTLFNRGFDPSNQNTNNCGPGGTGSGTSHCPSEYELGSYPIYQVISVANHDISSSLKTQPNSLNEFVSTITPYSINGTDQIALNPILTCDPRKNLGPHQFLNGNCFSLPTVPGQNGPTVLPEFFGPWNWTSDLSLFKNFQMGERKKVQFRFSAYNFMNHPLWSFSGSGVGSNSLYLIFAPGATPGSQVQ